MGMVMMPTVGFLGVADGRIHDADVAATLLPFLCWVPLLKLNFRKKGTLTLTGLLRNLVGQLNQCRDLNLSAASPANL